MKALSFDYIVVGAGSAGCVLANRLSADASVLLLEAGPEDDADEIKMPASFARLFKTKWDWNFETVEQKFMAGRRAYWPRMKALGGCSSMNAMIYIRGARADYDGWRDAHGAEGWGYADVLPYFVRSEGNTRFGGPYHGHDGPLHVEDRRYTHPLTEVWIDAAVAWGMKPRDDFNGAEQEGAGRYQVTCRHGRRWSTADAFLRPVLDRPALTVRTGALVSKVLIEDGRAVGVEYLRDGVLETVRADREVVLTGGAVNSPQLLMLSGIGPAAHLREIGIEVVADVPGVGENLHDHPAAGLSWNTRHATDLADYESLTRLMQWQLTGRGPIASNIAEGGGFFSSQPGLPGPDLQALFVPTAFKDNGLRETPGRHVTAAVTLVSPASRGRLRLRSADPSWRPEIDPQYYADAADLDAMVHGAKVLLEIAHQPALAKYLDTPFMPEKIDGISDEELRTHIRETTQTLYHPVGTCAMGTGETAVVDPQLRVRGVEGLRVADASVMPVVPRGNTNAPTIMVGEKAADLILGRDPLPAATV